MKFKTSISLMIALVLGLITAKVGVDMLKKYGNRPGVEMRVVVAAHNIEAGAVLQADDVTLKTVPASMASDDKLLRDAKAAVGRTVLTPVVSGFPLTDAALSEPGSGGGMQALVPKGFRAVTVEVSESSGVAGLLTPGCHVDVIATLRKGDQTVAVPVVENVKVQYVQRRSSRSSGSDWSTPGSASSSSSELGPAKTVTLLVTPKQAAAIELANSEGKPRLVLRGNGDTASSDDGTMSRNQLLGLPDEPEKPAEPTAPTPPPPAVAAGPTDAFSDAPEPKKGRTVEIIRNGSSSTITFDEDGAGKPDAKQQQDGSGGAAPVASSGKDGGKKGATGESARSVLGTSPDKAPRTDAGSGNLRKGN